jgi:adenylate cyclase
MTLLMLGRPNEAMAPIQQAMRLSPRDQQVPIWQMFAGIVQLHLGNDAAAVEWLKRSVAGYPMSPFCRLFLASALGVSGQIPEAQAQMAHFQQLRPGFTLSRFRAVELSDAPAFRKQRERVYEGLRRAGMPE